MTVRQVRSFPKLTLMNLSGSLAAAVFETHLEETEAQIERLEECFDLLDIQPRRRLARA